MHLINTLLQSDLIKRAVYRKSCELQHFNHYNHHLNRLFEAVQISGHSMLFIETIKLYIQFPSNTAS